ncbi:MAG: hypothetical protein HKN16_04700 [Saprospiraceae bacterium]|nr:hypothetical protein [Saprospiraceae bacterium]
MTTGNNHAIIEEGIRFLISDHGKVDIPGIGTFKGSYKSAHFDPVEGTISPPTLFVELFGNEEGTNVMLADFLVKNGQCSFQEANQAIQDFSKVLLQQLEKKEIISLPGMGRLFFDFQNDLKFVQDGGNQLFHSFGLPVLEFKPINRKGTFVASTSSQKKIEKKRGNSVSRIQEKILSADFVPITAGLAMFILFLGLFYITPQKQVSFADQMIDKRARPERVNVKPGTSLTSDDTKAQALSPVTMENEEAIKREIEEAFEEPGKTNIQEAEEISLTKESTVVIVGAYKYVNGIRLRKEQIEKLGFEFYSDRRNSLTRVGATIIHTTPEELETAIGLLKTDVNPRAWVLRSQ